MKLQRLGMSIIRIKDIIGASSLFSQQLFCSQYCLKKFTISNAKQITVRIAELITFNFKICFLISKHWKIWSQTWQ